MAAGDYVSDDPYAGDPLGEPTPPGGMWGGNQSNASDPVAAKWKIGDPIPAGYETYHPYGDVSKLLIRRTQGGDTGGPPPPSAPIKIGDQTDFNGQTWTWNGKTWDNAAAAAATKTGASTAGSPYTGDPTNVDTWLQWLAQQPGHDPILDTPQGQAYYKQRIGETGGLSASNAAYWQNKATLAANGGAVGAPEGGAGSFGSLWNHVPTLEEAQAMPGFQFALDSARQSTERSAAANGTLLTGGTQKDIQDRAIQTAYGQYFNLANLGINVNNSNAQNLYNFANLGYNASSYGGGN